MSHTVSTQESKNELSQERMTIKSFRDTLDTTAMHNAKRISAELKISHILSHILTRRGIETPEQAKSFLHPTLRNDLSDPSKLKNAEAAVRHIVHAIKEKKYITIFSDFDVDGISSASQLWLILKDTGAKLRYYVPNRITEGYGLSEKAIRKLHAEKTNLLITLDCGITNYSEVHIAKELGLDVIIIDHHELGEKQPPADYIINPMQQDCGFSGQKLCTAGIIWLIGILLNKELEKSENLKSSVSSKDLLDIAAIGTICDMVPLLGINRLIASRGIALIKEKARIGIKAIQEVAQLPQGDRFSCSHIAFGIGPRLNAAGRLDDATLGMNLLISQNESEAKSFAEKIHSLNEARKSHEEQVKSKCILLAKTFEEIIGEPPSAFILHDKSFHVGVIGIAAQRMVETFKKPTAVLGKPEEHGTSPIFKGSVRSFSGFHVAQTLKELSPLLITHGGHKEAGGFAIHEENILPFAKEFNSIAKKYFEEIPHHKETHVDDEISFKDINISLVKEIELLSPFGIGNPSPLFFTKGVVIEHIQVIGSNHIKMELSHDGVHRNGIAWRMLGNPALIQGTHIDIVYSLEINTYKGVSSVQLIIKEVNQSHLRTLPPQISA